MELTKEQKWQLEKRLGDVRAAEKSRDKYLSRLVSQWLEENPKYKTGQVVQSNQEGEPVYFQVEKVWATGGNRNNLYVGVHGPAVENGALSGWSVFNEIVVELC